MPKGRRADGTKLPPPDRQASLKPIPSVTRLFHDENDLGTYATWELNTTPEETLKIVEAWFREKPGRRAVVEWVFPLGYTLGLKSWFIRAKRDPDFDYLRWSSNKGPNTLRVFFENKSTRVEALAYLHPNYELEDTDDVDA